MTRLVDAGLVAADWNQNEYDGLRHQVGRRPRRPQGQPQGHHRLGRPDQAGRRGHHAEPVHLRRRQVEHHGRLRRPAASRARPRTRPRRTSRTSSTTCRCRTRARREALQTFVGGKGDVLLSYENEAIAAQQAGEDVEYVVPAETILIENPVAVTEDAATSRGGQGVLRLPLHARGPEDLRRPRATARSSRASPARTSSPTPAEPVHDRRPRRLGAGQRRPSSPRTAA